jgi:hypothetical protein
MAAEVGEQPKDQMYAGISSRITAVAEAEAAVAVATFREDGGVPGTLMIWISDPPGSTITPETSESGRVVPPLPWGGREGKTLMVPVCPAAPVGNVT